ncbi:hypothetical protein K458DRAFT_266239, partial [Lentithecium fluviatile CBS 122367]
LPPHFLSLIDWSDPLQDPVMRQYVPLASQTLPDHWLLTLEHSPAEGIIHKYPDRAVFNVTPVCPMDCRYFTPSYTVRTGPQALHKQRFLPVQKKWDAMLDYISRTPSLAEILICGDDAYPLSPDHLRDICGRLLEIPHIRRIQIASKGMAVCPSKLIDPKDEWANTLTDLARQGREMGKRVEFHTHFNHPQKITWITESAAQRLFKEGVIVRNQTVLLDGINKDGGLLRELIKQLASMNIEPCLVQGDMVRGIEDLHAPVHEIIGLEAIQGSTAGSMTP